MTCFYTEVLSISRRARDPAVCEPHKHPVIRFNDKNREFTHMLLNLNRSSQVKGRNVVMSAAV